MPLARPASYEGHCTVALLQSFSERVWIPATSGHLTAQRDLGQKAPHTRKAENAKRLAVQGYKLVGAALNGVSSAYAFAVWLKQEEA